MARPQSVEDAEVMAKLSCVFRDVGYEGASLAILAEATGLKKASLYHRFPGGKQQMAEEVLASALEWYETNILGPLRSDISPSERVAAVSRNLDGFYAGGQQACLLNMLASPRAELGPFSAGIKGAFEALVAAFTVVARDAGHDAKAAKLRAERSVMLLQGSLVMSRGLGSSRPFKTFLAGLTDDLIGAPSPSSNPARG
jgi:TetR/AcrR family transcriptional regulator, lmrAB and yxaGH operons repressor